VRAWLESCKTPARSVVDNGWRKPAPLTFETAIAEWFASAEIEKAWKPRTVYAYRGIVARLNDTFGRRPLAEIEPGDVVAYKGAMLKTHGPYSVSRDLVILHQFFKWALIAKGLRSNPAQGVPHPRLPKWRGQALAPELVQALLRRSRTGRTAASSSCFILTGVRRMELQALRWANVDLIENPATRRRLEDEDRGTLDCAAADARRGAVAAPPPQPLRERPRPHLLPPDRGTVYRVDHQWKPALKKACPRAGVTLPVGMRPMHDVGRVTSITNGVRANEHGSKLQARAGHASFATTQRYIDLAGVVFHDEAAALEERMLGLSTELSTRLTASQDTSDDAASLESAVSA
jgi:integrase